VRIVHAPSNRRAKGTEHVVAAVERLQAENVPVELELVEGLTHVEAQRLYAQADIVVDQLLVGWYGGFAVEMMALGKPVVAYVRDEDLVHIPDAMRAELPVISATPDTITDVLRRLVTDEGRRLPELGRRGRAYVERWHDPRAIAGRLKGVYEEIMQSRR
jgi:glycosyltransferase involved in cell wall biosynthesis